MKKSDAESKFPQPTDEELSGFVEGDPIAIDGVVRAVLVPLIRWARKEYDGLPPDEIESLMHQALGEICINHHRFDPSRSKFTTYVINLFKMRVRDLMAKRKNIINLESFSLDNDEEYEKHENFLYNFIEDEDPNISTKIFFEEVMDRLDDIEREFLHLMRTGEKDQKIFVDVLAQYQDIVDPSKQVKNTKEKLQRKLRRLADELGYAVDDLL